MRSLAARRVGNRASRRERELTNLWQDSGTLRVTREVPGGTLDPGKLVSGLARAAHTRGAIILESHRVRSVAWGKRPVLKVVGGRSGTAAGQIGAGKVLFATNGLSLELSGLIAGAHPKLTLATVTAPVSDERIRALGLAGANPFYTVDFPYLWGRIRKDNSIVWGAGLVDPPAGGHLEEVNIDSAEPAGMFAKFEKRVHGLHPAAAALEFTHHWGGPILFRDNWEPVFDWHPQSRNALVLGAFAGHGVALSNYPRRLGRRSPARPPIPTGLAETREITAPRANNGAPRSDRRSPAAGNRPVCGLTPGGARCARSSARAAQTFPMEPHSEQMIHCRCADIQAAGRRAGQNRTGKPRWLKTNRGRGRLAKPSRDSSPTEDFFGES